MGNEAIDRILEEKRKATEPAPAQSEQEDKFFSILGGEGLHEEFLEFQLKNGNRTMFSYSDLNWVNYDPKEGCIDLEFGSALVTVKGRGLVPKLWQGIKTKRVAWIKEADTEMQDHNANESFISEILITPASTGENEGTAPPE